MAPPVDNDATGSDATGSPGRPEDPGAPAGGRCVYCGERCEAQATYHHFCRYEHEMEVAEKSGHAAHLAGRGTGSHDKD